MSDGEHDIDYWKKESERLREQLQSAEADIADFTESSKELQDELEKELARLESSETSLRQAAEEKGAEASEWKEKYKNAIGEHTKTVTQMSRELEERRREEKALRDRLRDMELDNDEMEKSERQKDSTLNDLEARYNRSLERIALLEEELVQKATLVEEVQRLKDELRDLNEELVVSRQAAVTVQAQAVQPRAASPPPPRRRRSPSPETETPTAPPKASTSSPTKSRIPQSPSMAGFANSPFALARSVRTTFVPTPPVSEPAQRPRSKPETTISDLRNATSRLKAISASLSHNRDLRMAGSSIPRVGGTPRASHRPSLSTTVRPSSAFQRPPSRATSHNEDDHRPPSRSMMRQSTRTSAVPRPSSRLSHVPLPSSSGASSAGLGQSVRRVSRPSTPVDRARSPTPGAGPSSLAQSARRRISMNGSSNLGVSSPVPPVPSLPASKAREYAQQGGSGGAANENGQGGVKQGSMFGLGRPSGPAKPDRDQLARRASLALGRSVLNKR